MTTGVATITKLREKQTLIGIKPFLQILFVQVLIV
jgi:hypothetical protein